MTTPEFPKAVLGTPPRNSGVGSFFVCHALFASTLLTAFGCRQDMHDQPKLKPLAKSDFHADQRASRPQVEGTIARGQLVDDSPFYTGKVQGQLTNELPIQLTPALLNTGRERFESFCAPCHGRTGDGYGMVVQRGFKQPTSFHTDRLRQMPLGHFFDAMTNGFGAMADYRAQVSTADRWAVAAYVRALQLSQNARLEDVPADRRGELEGKPKGPASSEGGH